MEKEQQKKLLTEITAVEWLVNELKSYTFHERIDMAEWEELKKLSRKAKQMEKEQVINACIHTASALSNVGLSDTTINAEIELAKQYYNETYNK